MLAQSRQMMTADWTSIGRRLAVRGTAHRPPWGAREARHRAIVAPIATSVAVGLAATLAMRAGAALARAERDRREHRRRVRAQGQFALLPGEGTGEGIRRIALSQLELAAGLLGGEGGSAPDERAVHETRKALKRLRALLRLLRDTLGEEEYERENRALRDIGRRLSAARDAEVMVATLDSLRERHPRKLGARDDLRRLREAFVAEREVASARTLGDGALLEQVISELYGIRARVYGWQLAAGKGLALAEPGLERVYRQGRARYRRASRTKADGGRALHEWRKRVKDLRHAAEILDRRDPELGPGKRARRERRRRRDSQRVLQARIGKTARRADQLGEMLGEEHDLAVLRARVQASELGGVQLGRRCRKRLSRRIARRRRKLRTRALREGAKLYGHPSRRFSKRVKAGFKASARGARELSPR
jgi:CHAD domain